MLNFSSAHVTDLNMYKILVGYNIGKELTKIFIQCRKYPRDVILLAMWIAWTTHSVRGFKLTLDKILRGQMGEKKGRVCLLIF